MSLYAAGHSSSHAAARAEASSAAYSPAGNQARGRLNCYVHALKWPVFCGGERKYHQTLYCRGHRPNSRNGRIMAREKFHLASSRVIFGLEHDYSAGRLGKADDKVAAFSVIMSPAS